MHKTNVNTAISDAQANVVNTTLLEAHISRRAADFSALALNAEVTLEMIGEQLDAITHPDVQRALLRINALVAGVQRSVMLLSEAAAEISLHPASGEEVAA
jgi:hypothetical protein